MHEVQEMGSAPQGYAEFSGAMPTIEAGYTSAHHLVRIFCHSFVTESVLASYFSGKVSHLKFA